MKDPKKDLGWESRDSSSYSRLRSIIWFRGNQFLPEQRALDICLFFFRGEDSARKRKEPFCSATHLQAEIIHQQKALKVTQRVLQSENEEMLAQCQ